MALQSHHVWQPGDNLLSRVTEVIHEVSPEWSTNYRETGKQPDLQGSEIPQPNFLSPTGFGY